MEVVEQLFANNRAHAARLGNVALPTRPRLGLAVVACMDSRIDLFAVLGLRNGDAHIIRNAGGIVTDDVRRSLAISRRLLGTSSVLVIQHTRCGLHRLDEQGLRAQIEAEGTTVPFPFGAFQDLEQSVRDSMRKLSSDPLLGPAMVRGAIYDVDSRRLEEVRV